MIISCLTEILLLTILNNIFLKNYLIFSSSVNAFTFIFLPFWLILSYIFGRYSYNEDLYKNRNLILFFKLFIRTLIIANLSIIFVLMLSININLNNYNHFDKVILIYTSYLSLVVNIIQIPIIKQFIKNAQKEDLWIFFGTKSLFYLLKKELNLSRKKLKILYYSDKLQSKLLSLKNIKGLLVSDIKNYENSKFRFIFELRNSNIKIYNIEKWCENYLQRLPCEFLTITYLTNSFTNYSMQMRLKRVGDIVLSIILFVILFPILLFSSVLIYLEDKHGFIYKQERVGKNQKIFTLYKLRTMKYNSEKGKPQWSRKFDSRITKVGKFLRKTRLDELPQLINVIIGDMSLIGPRPEREIFDIELSKHIPQYNSRYLIKPGLSGWAQVNFPYGSSVEDSKKKFSYDIYYLKNFSIWLDFLILLKTIKIIFLKKGSEPIR